jgi:phosphatidylglycerophosphatase A
MSDLEKEPQAVVLDIRFLISHPAYLFALGFGSGLSPVLQGTAGTLFAWLSFGALSAAWPDIFNTYTWAAIIVAGFFYGISICHKTGIALNCPDHGCMVWDEIIAFWLVLLLLMPASITVQFSAFLVFRFFDMVKPQPIKYFDTHFKGGFGVMWDDIVAAFFTLLVFALWSTYTSA